MRDFISGCFHAGFVPARSNPLDAAQDEVEKRKECGDDKQRAHACGDKLPHVADFYVRRLIDRYLRFCCKYHKCSFHHSIW